MSAFNNCKTLLLSCLVQIVRWGNVFLKLGRKEKFFSFFCADSRRGNSPLYMVFLPSRLHILTFVTNFYNMSKARRTVALRSSLTSEPHDPSPLGNQTAISLSLHRAIRKFTLVGLRIKVRIPSNYSSADGSTEF